MKEVFTNYLVIFNISKKVNASKKRAESKKERKRKGSTVGLGVSTTAAMMIF